MALVQPITPCLWFDDQAEEAAKLYTAIFRNSKINDVARFGKSWQVFPQVLIDMITDPDPAKSQRATEAMLKMKKLDIAELRQAYAG